MKKHLARLKPSMIRITWRNTLRTIKQSKLSIRKESLIFSRFRNIVSELSKQEKILSVRTEQDQEKHLDSPCH